MIGSDATCSMSFDGIIGLHASARRRIQMAIWAVCKRVREHKAPKRYRRISALVADDRGHAVSRALGAGRHADRRADGWCGRGSVAHLQLLRAARGGWGRVGEGGRLCGGRCGTHVVSARVEQPAVQCARLWTARHAARDRRAAHAP